MWRFSDLACCFWFLPGHRMNIQRPATWHKKIWTWDELHMGDRWWHKNPHISLSPYLLMCKDLSTSRPVGFRKLKKWNEHIFHPGEKEKSSKCRSAKNVGVIWLCQFSGGYFFTNLKSNFYLTQQCSEESHPTSLFEQHKPMIRWTLRWANGSRIEGKFNIFQVLGCFILVTNSIETRPCGVPNGNLKIFS